jgi:hypothetical protein
LWEHDYVERILGQVDRRLLYKGSFPIIYGLTRPADRLRVYVDHRSKWHHATHGPESAGRP